MRSPLDPSIHCALCSSPYTSTHQPIFADIPGCRHAFGRSCLLARLSEADNSCPTCKRTWFLAAADYAQQAILRARVIVARDFKAMLHDLDWVGALLSAWRERAERRMDGEIRTEYEDIVQDYAGLEKSMRRVAELFSLRQRNPLPEVGGVREALNDLDLTFHELDDWIGEVAEKMEGPLKGQLEDIRSDFCWVWQGFDGLAGRVIAGLYGERWS